MKRKICVVVTARPSYSRVQSVLSAIQSRKDLALQLVVAASALLDRYGNTVKQIESDGFPVTAKVYMALEGSTPVTSTKTTGLGMLDLATVFDNIKPDAVVTIADRFETIATALAAANMNIPLVHIQGGEITGSIDEKIRHAVTKLADLHFVSTEKAKEHVIKMGEHPERVFNTGCPSIDIAAKVFQKQAIDFDPIEKYSGVGDILDFSAPYVIVMQHPVTTEYLHAREQIDETLKAVMDVDVQALWFWPNMDSGSDEAARSIRIFREKNKAQHIRFFKSMAPDDFLKVLCNSKAIVGNSSVAIREASFLGVPAVNIGTRQTGRERGPNVMDVPYDHVEIAHAIQKQLAHGYYRQNFLYGKGHSGENIAQLLATLPFTTEKILMYS